LWWPVSLDALAVGVSLDHIGLDSGDVALQKTQVYA
jgi:hypothetical protein